MKSVLLLLLMLAPAAIADRVLYTTGWVANEEMTPILQKMNKNSLFPCHVVGSVKESTIIYQASYCEFLPEMTYFYSRWGLSDSEYERYAAYYIKKKKMQPHFHTTFTDEEGGTRHQATWILIRNK